MPEQQCADVPRHACRQVPDQVCTNQPKQQCSKRPVEQCTAVHKKSPVRVSKRVPKKVCNDRYSGPSPSNRLEIFDARNNQAATKNCQAQGPTLGPTQGRVKVKVKVRTWSGHGQVRSNYNSNCTQR